MARLFKTFMHKRREIIKIARMSRAQFEEMKLGKFQLLVRQAA
jgi:hypothetical protein